VYQQGSKIMTKEIPSNWIDVGNGIYHHDDMAIYSNDKNNEVHLLSVTKSKFSLLLSTKDWNEILNFVKERGVK
jgi:hypothetical protein